MATLTDTMVAPIPTDAGGSTSTLSSADVVEIKRFAESKSRIVDLTEMLSSKPHVDPFEGFVRVDDSSGAEGNSVPTVEAITEAWKDLEEKLEQVTVWQDERDDIETEATQFEVGDMERLRQVAKAASEREMSPQDTDLIEITIQTLFALDALLRLLKSRREALELFQSRLRWEERRKDCWTTYVSLSHDLDDFVAQARWSPQIYQRGATEQANPVALDADESNAQEVSISEWSPSTTRSNGESALTSTSNAKRQATLIKLQGAALQKRSRSFICEVVPLSGKQLDDMIEQRQLPEVFLDEQDRLEDLAESIKSREVFMIQLSVQWRRADEIFRQLRSMHIQGKQLAATLSSAQREIPSQERQDVFCQQRDMLKRNLESLCGVQCTIDFLSDKNGSSQSTSIQLQTSLPEPQCKTWTDQQKHSSNVKDILTKELSSAAKHVRQVCQSTDKYDKSLQSFEKLQLSFADLNHCANEYEEITRRARQGWIVEMSEAEDRTSTLNLEQDNSGAPNLLDDDCLDPSKYRVYIDKFSDLKLSMAKIDKEASQQTEAMKQVIADCIRLGMPHSLFRKDADRVTNQVNVTKKEASSAIESSNILLDALYDARQVHSQMKQLQSDCKVCLDKEADLLMIGVQSTSLVAMPLMEEIKLLSETLLNRTKEMSGKIQFLNDRLEALGAQNLIKTFIDQEDNNQQMTTSIHHCCRWLEAMKKQHMQLATLEEEYGHLSMIGHTIKSDKEGEEHSSMSTELCLPEETVDQFPMRGPLSRLETDRVCSKILDYVSTAHSNVVLCGPVPSILLQTVSSGWKASDCLLDERTRSKVNEWCSLLSTLSKEIETAYEDSSMRESTRKQEMQQFFLDQKGFDSALADLEKDTLQAKDLCDSVETELDGLLEGKSSLNLSETEQKRALDDVQEVLHNSMRRLVDTKKGRQCSASLMAKLEDNKEIFEAVVDRADSLKQRLAEVKSLLQARQNDAENTKSGQAAVAISNAVSIISDSARVQESILPVDKGQQGPLPTSEAVEVTPLPLLPLEEDLKYENDKEKISQDDHVVESDQASANENSVLENTIPAGISSSKEESKIQCSDGIKSTAATEDVFGPMSHKNSATISDGSGKNLLSDANVKERLRGLMQHCVGGTVEEQTQANGKIQLQSGLALPTAEEAQTIKQDWKTFKSDTLAVLTKHKTSLEQEVESLQKALQIRDAKVRRFGLLASFGVVQSSMEDTLSRFLNLLDQSGEIESKEKLQGSLVELSKILDQATLAAEPILTDVRVRHQLSKLRHSFQDMAAMAKEVLDPSDKREQELDAQSDCLSRSSSVTSVPSLSGSISDGESLIGEERLQAASSSTRPIFESLSEQFAVPDLPKTPLPRRIRTQSNSSATYVTAPQSTPRQSMERRVVSENTPLVTPSRIPITKSHSTRDMPTPKVLAMSNGNSDVTGTTRRTPRSSGDHHERSRSDSGAKLWSKLPVASPSKTSIRGSLPKTPTSLASSKPNQYRANPQSKLDVAVGKIVNKLPIQVKITHASATGTKAKEQWHDESGRYWVGQPDPKLCFCRILRSRTVMVRIGGGWQELTTYILKHYSHLAPDANLSVAASSQGSPHLDRAKMDELPWIGSSTLLHTPKAKAIIRTAEYSPESAYLTPMHERAERRTPSGNVRSMTPLPSKSMTTPLSPIMLDTQVERSRQSPDEMHGIWIRRDRKISHHSNSSGSSLRNFSMTSQSEETFDHTRSTASSRSRKLSKSGTSEGRRVDSISGMQSRTQKRADSISGGGSIVPNRARVNSITNGRLFSADLGISNRPSPAIKR